MRTFSIPDKIRNEVIVRKNKNNDLVHKSAKLRVKMQRIVNEINSIEAERALNLDELHILVRENVPEIRPYSFTYNFDEMKITQQQEEL